MKHSHLLWALVLLLVCSGAAVDQQDLDRYYPDEIYVDRKIQEYIVDLVIATRDPEKYGLQLQELIQFGGSPRATINLTLAAKANAFLEGRGYVIPQDVKDIAMDVLRHRIVVTYEAEAEEKTSEDIVNQILGHLPVP